MTIHENIRTLRRQKNMTQQQLADACHMARTTIAAYEAGHGNPRPSTVAKLARGLGVTTAELCGMGMLPGITDAAGQEAAPTLRQAMPDGNRELMRLLAAFDRLSLQGRAEAAKRIEELAQLPAYRAIRTPAGD